MTLQSNPPPASSDEHHISDLVPITGNESVLVLVTLPGEEAALCGGFIRECCKRGRAPFVVVVTDGTDSASINDDPGVVAARHERATRSAAKSLGIPHDRILMLGLYKGTVPCNGPYFNKVLDAIIFLTWRHDCNAICAPLPDGSGDHHAVSALGKAVAETIKIRRINYSCQSFGDQHISLKLRHGTFPYYLDISPHVEAKSDAMKAHNFRSAPDEEETYFVRGSD